MRILLRVIVSLGLSAIVANIFCLKNEYVWKSHNVNAGCVPKNANGKNIKILVEFVSDQLLHGSP